MPVETFDPTPFKVLEALLEGPLARNERDAKALRRVCETCIGEFDKIGGKLDEFVANIEDNLVLFELLANALRTAKRSDFLFKRGAQLFSEIGSVKNSIKRISNGSVKKSYRELALSFSKALKERAEVGRAAA
jgi:hypothetical protein